MKALGLLLCSFTVHILIVKTLFIPKGKDSYNVPTMWVLIWNKHLTVLWPVSITTAHQHCQSICKRLNTEAETLIIQTDELWTHEHGSLLADVED